MKTTNTTEITLLGHNISIDVELKDDAYNSAVDYINQSILEGYDCGYSTANGIDYNWEIIEPSVSNLEDAAKKLEKNDEVIFTHNDLVYKAYLRSDNDYEIEIYDMSSFCNGDELTATDSLIFDGTASEAIAEATESEVCELDTSNFYNLIKVAHHPALSENTISYIKENLASELEGDDCYQYQLDYVCQNLDDCILDENDKKIFIAFEKDAIDYIEL